MKIFLRTILYTALAIGMSMRAGAATANNIQIKQWNPNGTALVNRDFAPASGTTFTTASGFLAALGGTSSAVVDGYFADPSTNASFLPANWRTDLSLGGAALLDVGTTAGTVAAGDDSRITGAASAASVNGYFSDPSTNGSFAPNAWVSDLGSKNTYIATNYGVTGDGVTDDQPLLKAFFATVAGVSGQKTIIIPPGTYYIGLEAGNSPVIPSDTTIIADGAKFLFPTTIPGSATGYPKPSAFTGVDVTDTTWRGGEFMGYVFNPVKAGGYATNTWLPSEGVRGLYFTSTNGNGCHRLNFIGIKGNDTGGEVVSVNGTSTTDATNISMTGCLFINCGQFMWDYGYLWQLLTWDTEYTSDLVAMADQYMVSTSKIGSVTMTSASDTVLFDNDPTLIPISAHSGPTQVVTFYGTTLPSNITRGLQYYVVDSSATGIKVSATFGGAAITFASSGSDAKMLYNMANAYDNMFSPAGAIGGKGAHTFTYCDGLTISGNTWSAPGDSHHIQESGHVSFVNNRVTDARMGSVFFEGVRNSEIVGNDINGGNGSRILTLENVVDTQVTGNTFYNGGRGAIINDLVRVAITHNSFYKNTTKGTTSFPLGRRHYSDGSWGQYPIMSMGSDLGVNWSNVDISHNRIVEEYAAYGWLLFNRAGSGLRITGNIFEGTLKNINSGVSYASIGNASISGNIGMTEVNSALIDLGFVANGPVTAGAAVQSNGLGVNPVETTTSAQIYVGNSDIPRMALTRASNSANARIYDFIVAGDGDIRFRSVGDAFSGTTTWLQATGLSSTTPGTVTFPGLLAAGSGPTTLTNAAGNLLASALTGTYPTAGLTMNTARLLGRTTASSGAAEEITVNGTNFTFTGGALNTVQNISTSSTVQFGAVESLGGLAPNGTTDMVKTIVISGIPRTTWVRSASTVNQRIFEAMNVSDGVFRLRWTRDDFAGAVTAANFRFDQGVEFPGVLYLGSGVTAINDASGKILSAALNTVAVAQGGTGQTTYTDGQLLIGNTTGNTLTKATLTEGAGVEVTNGTGTITLAQTGMSSLRTGTAVLVGGTVTVADAATTTSTRFRLSYNTPGGTPGAVYISAVTASTNFTITSTSGSDTSTVYYEAFEP